jgi:transgelin
LNYHHDIDHEAKYETDDMSFDRDVAQRLQEKYDPAMADEARDWIEHTLGETLPQDDLIDSLLDGTVLCRLLNIVTPGSTKYKVSKMPFVQVLVRSTRMLPLT